MTTPARGGPDRISAEEARAFLVQQPSGTLCIGDAASLDAATARILDVDHDGHTLLVSIAAGTEVRHGPACFVADIYETYASIRGVIVQGHAAVEAPQLLRITVARITGFSFAGKVPGNR